MRLAKHFLTLLLCSVLIACSLAKTGYNNAPALTIWWLNDYFNFTPEQQALLKPSLQKLHQWHRQTQLPEYVKLLQNLQVSLSKDEFSADEFCDTLDAVKANINTLQVESIPIIIELAPTLSNKQLQRFQAKLIERTQKWKKEWWQESQADQLNARYEKAEDFAEDVYGDLSDAQLNQLKQSITEANINPAITYKEILRRNEDAYQTINSLRDNKQTDKEKFELTKDSFARTQASPDATYQTYANALTKHTCQSMAKFYASTTPKQKQHAKNWLQDYINQLATLQINN